MNKNMKEKLSIFGNKKMKSANLFYPKFVSNFKKSKMSKERKINYSKNPSLATFEIHVKGKMSNEP